GQDRACDQTNAFGGCQPATTTFQQLAIAQHRTQALVQGFAPHIVTDVQGLGDGVCAQKAAALGQQRQDRLATRDGMFVTPRFALGVGIDEASTLPPLLGFAWRELLRLALAGRRRLALWLVGFFSHERLERGSHRPTIALGYCASVPEQRRERKSA